MKPALTLRHLLPLALAAPMLAPGLAAATDDDGGRVRLAALQMQDLEAALRPQPRRAAPPPGADHAPTAPTLLPTPPAAVAVPTPTVVASLVAPLPHLAPAPPAAAPTAPVAAEVAANTAPPVSLVPALSAGPAVPAASAALQPVLAAEPPATPPQRQAANTPRTPVATAAEPRFDLAINNAPAAQVFLQIANGTPWNMLVSPEVSGTLSITLKDTTVPEAMDTLRELFGYDFRITGNRIFVYSNAVQTRLYRVNYLPGRRQGASDTRVSSSAITVSGNSGNGNGNNLGQANGNSQGSGNRPDDSAHVRTTSDADFWREVQSSLTALVGSQGGRSVVLNPAAGVVVVKATPAELRQVEQYLKAVQLSIERQVMLEAKIVEVMLSKDSQTGINWSGFGNLGGRGGKLSIGSAAPGSTLGTSGNLGTADGTSIAPGVSMAAGGLGRGFYGLAFQAANFAGLLNFLQTQGDVQVLSSPRIATLNNQKAVLKVGSDEFYVTGVTTSTTSTGTNSVSSPTLTMQPFFSGISLDVTPQIDEAGNVMLHVHPTISTVTEKNKNIDLGSLGSLKLPMASSAVNESDSIVRVKDGQIVAIGGLMKVEMRDERTGLPVVSEVPVVGGMFRQTGTVQSKRELVIMLKPTVIHDDGAWPDAPSLAEATPVIPAGR
jgi:MSHA biogenesis protein MshL